MALNQKKIVGAPRRGLLFRACMKAPRAVHGRLALLDDYAQVIARGAYAVSHIRGPSSSLPSHVWRRLLLGARLGSKRSASLARQERAYKGSPVLAHEASTNELLLRKSPRRAEHIRPSSNGLSRVYVRSRIDLSSRSDRPTPSIPVCCYLVLHKHATRLVRSVERTHDFFLR